MLAADSWEFPRNSFANGHFGRYNPLRLGIGHAESSPITPRIALRPCRAIPGVRLSMLAARGVNPAQPAWDGPSRRFELPGDCRSPTIDREGDTPRLPPDHSSGFADPE